VTAEARKAGINESWLQSAKDSPIYKLAMKWRIALPLHPEYRTLPMVWYVPPLSPIMNHIEESNLQTDHYIPAVEHMRIPMEYLASLMSAGDTSVIRRVLLKMAAMRVHMRQLTVGGMDELAHSRLLQEAGMSADELEAMARLLAVAKYNERFVISTGRREMNDDLYYRQGACSLENIAPPEGMATYPFARGD
jgi:nitrate reductase beta subunit